MNDLSFPGSNACHLRTPSENHDFSQTQGILFLLLLIETLQFIHLYISLQEHSPLQKLKLLLLGTGIELDNETSSVIQRYYGDWLRGVETRRGAVNLVETAPRHYHQSTCENCQKPQCPVGWYFWPVRFNFR
jgi:hypothetical protein